MTGREEEQTGRQRGLHGLRRLRWRLRRGWAGLRYGRAALDGSPVFFGNSFPKGGTHLLAQILQAFPQVGLVVDRGMGPILTYARSTGRRRSPEEILGDLNALRPGDMGFGHVIADPQIQAGWRTSAQGRVAHYFMLRDPRDVVVSHAHYIGSKAVQNVHHEYYRSLPGLEERLRASILGRPDWEGDFPNIRERFELYLGWLDAPAVCVLKYEDFIAHREAALARMLQYARERGFRLSTSEVQGLERLATAIDPQRSFTFRSGKIGDWRIHFSAEHTRLFKEVAGDLLVRLGYETNQDW